STGGGPRRTPTPPGGPFFQPAPPPAGAALLSTGVHAAGTDTIRVGLVGCGNRGNGAAVQALTADPNAKLVAVADAFPDQIESSLKVIAQEPNLAKRIDVPPDRRFVGLD